MIFDPTFLRCFNKIVRESDDKGLMFLSPSAVGSGSHLFKEVFGELGICLIAWDTWVVSWFLPASDRDVMFLVFLSLKNVTEFFFFSLEKKAFFLYKWQ